MDIADRFYQSVMSGEPVPMDEDEQCETTEEEVRWLLMETPQLSTRSFSQVINFPLRPPLTQSGGRMVRAVE